MRATRLNLAQRPFVNERPARRTTILLWVVGLLLLTLNVMLFQRHLSGQQERRQRIKTLGASIAEERAAITGLEEELAALDLKQQNRRVVFLNTQIARRIFSWSRLLDDLAQVQPDTVQLSRLSPRITERQVSAGLSDRSRAGDVVAIEMGGVARSSEAILDFVDRLFEHPSFVAPDLANEREQEQKLYDFSLRVLYLPGESASGAPAAGDLSLPEAAGSGHSQSAFDVAREADPSQPSEPGGEGE